MVSMGRNTAARKGENMANQKETVRVPKMDEYGYADNDGQQCPMCGSEDIEGGQWHRDAGVDPSIAWQKMYCDGCGSTWEDEYKLIGYNDLVQ